MCAIKGAKPARQLSLQLPAHRTIALAAKQNSPEKSRLGKQRGESKQMPNRISQASFVVMLNSKGLLQIREEWAPQREKVTRTFHKEKCCYKGRYQLPIQRKYGDCELHKNRCVYTTDTQLQPFLLHLFSKIKKAKNVWLGFLLVKWVWGAEQTRDYWLTHKNVTDEISETNFWLSSPPTAVSSAFTIDSSQSWPRYHCKHRYRYLLL